MDKRTRLLHEARQAQDQGRFQAAADALLRAFRGDPTDFRICREVGRTLHAAGDLEASVCYLLRAFQAEPADAATVASLTALLREMGREEESSRVLLRALEQGLEPGQLALQLQRLD